MKLLIRPSTAFIDYISYRQLIDRRLIVDIPNANQTIPLVWLEFFSITKKMFLSLASSTLKSFFRTENQVVILNEKDTDAVFHVKYCKARLTLQDV